MPFKTPNKTSEYIRSILPCEKDDALRAITDYADKHILPVLIPETAAFLRQAVTILKPNKILEIGTSIGYSGHIILGACKGHLYTIEADEKSADVAENFFCKSGYEDRVTLIRGDSNEVIPLMSGEFDFIFMDGPKTRYVEYLPYLRKLMAERSAILCDNVLFNGMVSGENDTPKKKATIVVALDKFLRTLMADESLITSVLPVGDGVSFSITR